MNKDNILKFALLLCTVACSIVAGTLLAFLGPEAPSNLSQRTLTFAERVAYQRGIEDVYWRHRIWPKERPDSKPSLDAVMSEAQLEKKVEDYLGNSQALENYWLRPITPEQLQAEMERMAQHTKRSGVLRELFEALGNDPFVIAECLARPVLAERLVTKLYARDKEPLDASRAVAEKQAFNAMVGGSGNYTLPTISDGPNGCIDDTWTAISTVNAPAARDDHTAVWTGSEMIVWGGDDVASVLNTGGRYYPSTDSWTATSTVNAPTGRYIHTAAWSGSEMIVWGGCGDLGCVNGGFNTGGRYNPSTDSWTPTSAANAPTARYSHTAVWTGSEMIVWGGYDGLNYFNTGGRYDSNTDSWTTTSTTNAPTARVGHTVVWTNSEMIVWGGYDGLNFNTGGRYDPSTDSWTTTSTTNAPTARVGHTAIWTDSEMIIWGGGFNTGGRYNPRMDSWTTTSTNNSPSARDSDTAVWTGSEMIVWGGYVLVDGNPPYTNTGGRYDPSTDSWAATSTNNAPDARVAHTAVWIESEMIVWGGYDFLGGPVNTGGRYCAQSGAPPTPTPTATVTPTVTPTATATPTPTPRLTPTPRPRPSPRPRPTPQ